MCCCFLCSDTAVPCAVCRRSADICQCEETRRRALCALYSVMLDTRAKCTVCFAFCCTRRRIVFALAWQCVLHLLYTEKNCVLHLLDNVFCICLTRRRNWAGRDRLKQAQLSVVCCSRAANNNLRLSLEIRLKIVYLTQIIWASHIIGQTKSVCCSRAANNNLGCVRSAWRLVSIWADRLFEHPIIWDSHINIGQTKSRSVWRSSDQISYSWWIWASDN